MYTFSTQFPMLAACAIICMFVIHLTGGIFGIFLCMYFIQHWFICRPSDSTVSEDTEIEPRTVATSSLAVRRSSHSATSHLLSRSSTVGYISSTIDYISSSYIYTWTKIRFRKITLLRSVYKRKDKTFMVDHIVQQLSQIHFSSVENGTAAAKTPEITYNIYVIYM